MTISNHKPRVLIIGLGIAGPLLALLLKKKGYNPIILEKVSSLGDAGASMMLFPNGLKAISSISSALADKISSLSPSLEMLHDSTWKGEVLGGTKLPKIWKEIWGQPACGVKRTELNLLLKDEAVDAGIQVLEGWKLVDITHNADGTVTAISSIGLTQSGDFLVGCDGIHSTTRSILLQTHGQNSTDEPEFTGLIQTAGMSPTAASLRGVPGMRNWYGPDTHIIAYPVSGTTTSWAITSRSKVQELETWKALSPSELAAQKTSLLNGLETWDEPVRTLVHDAEKIIRYGLFDRPVLESKFWVSKEGRTVLIGDAAHPTSPHLGQGGNQAAEDAWWLASLLPDFGSEENGKDIDGLALREVFETFANMRGERTAMLVIGARAVGERRVMGSDECCERDEALRREWKDEKGIEEKWRGLLQEPFLT
ncbi:hypothetical protein VTL71DRAFT_13 [Oculimacula yallundae]|uniref:FAD-binding domain-containing protein n=1 Tax=Oculimacula yallundae TaxID=86028 RepID=A0ABR4CYX8_9HELO